MSDEKGLEEETPHTHIYCVFSSPVRFSTIKNLFPTAHLESARGTSEQNRNYVQKSGEKWENSEKQETSVEGTFEEWGEMPVESQGWRNDLKYLYAMIKDGYTNLEILEQNPDFMINLNDVERVRQELTAKEYENTFRIMEVTYIYGSAGVGKTRYVMEQYGYTNVYRVTDYIHPFDAYKGQDIILFDEFQGVSRDKFRIQDMNNYLDGYPLELPARYANKTACYEKVYIISNIDLKDMYKFEQQNTPEVWAALMRRIHKVIHFHKDGSYREYDTQHYLSGNMIELDPVDEKDKNPFVYIKRDIKNIK